LRRRARTHPAAQLVEFRRGQFDRGGGPAISAPFGREP
jgi:hypothetical protein